MFHIFFNISHQFFFTYLRYAPKNPPDIHIPLVMSQAEKINITIHNIMQLT